MSAPVVTYIEMLERGAVLPERHLHTVDGRDPRRDAKAVAGQVFAFRYFEAAAVADRFGVLSECDLCRRWRAGDLSADLEPTNLSGFYYIDADLLSLADVRAMNRDGGYDILISNMQNNGWDSILRCRTGNFRLLRRDDAVIRL